MADLTVGGVDVSVARTGNDCAFEEIGGESVVRTFDGTARLTRRGQKRRWSVTTTPLTAADRTTLLAQLQATTLPVSCAGDLLGATLDCVPVPQKETPMGVGGAIRWVLAFELWEA